MEPLQHAAVKVISDSGTVFLELFPVHVLSVMDHDVTRWGIYIQCAISAGLSSIWQAFYLTLPFWGIPDSEGLSSLSHYRWEIKTQGVGLGFQSRLSNPTHL